MCRIQWLMCFTVAFGLVAASGGVAQEKEATPIASQETAPTPGDAEEAAQGGVTAQAGDNQETKGEAAAQGAQGAKGEDDTSRNETPATPGTPPGAKDQTAGTTAVVDASVLPRGIITLVGVLEIVQPTEDAPAEATDKPKSGEKERAVKPTASTARPAVYLQIESASQRNGAEIAELAGQRVRILGPRAKAALEQGGQKVKIRGGIRGGATTDPDGTIALSAISLSPVAEEAAESETKPKEDAGEATPEETKGAEAPATPPDAPKPE